MDRTYGLYFPIALDGNGAPEYPGILDSIDASLRHIIVWSYGTRNFLYSFGSLTETLINAPNSKRNASLLAVFLKRSIATWETRIVVQDISFTIDGDTLTVHIEATVPILNISYEFESII